MSEIREDMVVGGGRTVFEDLGIAMSEKDMLKVNLAALIARLIQKRKLTQAQAAELMGIDQPKVSKLLRGKLQEFTGERLMTFVLSLGHDINISVSEEAKTVPGTVQLVA